MDLKSFPCGSLSMKAMAFCELLIVSAGEVTFV